MSTHWCDGPGCEFCEQLAEEIAESQNAYDPDLADAAADRWEANFWGDP